MTSSVLHPLEHAVKPSKQAAKRHYGSHPYFTKRAWNVVQEYIRHFSSPGDTVLDPFGGSGVTAVESLVLRRKAVYVDISAWATFLARQTTMAPINLNALRGAFADLEARCRPYLDQVWAAPEQELQKQPIRDYYPQKVPLPSNADVQFVEELFTPRMLHGLAYLRGRIVECRHATLRDLLLMAFSATLVRINRTFLSAKNRLESRGGIAIFSIYRYKVAKRPVELPLWKQFSVRVERLLEAKNETNELIGDFYKENETAIFRQGSATRLLDFLKPRSINYIYTDPPYGSHIAYLDLSTMWTAWLGFEITPEDRADEVIEGGELRKTRQNYHDLLGQSLRQMHEVLKPGAWMSLVFAHRDTNYWDALVDDCAAAGFRYVNTVVQPVGVVWSMHKKKNPLRVLSGELVLNFRKPEIKQERARPLPEPHDVIDVVRACCAREIVYKLGATTEELHHVVIPKLLEAGLLRSFSKQHGDLVPVLTSLFDFDDATGKWNLREDALPDGSKDADLARYHIARFLSRSHREGAPAAETEIRQYLSRAFKHNGLPSDKTFKRLLHEVGTCSDGSHWLPKNNCSQGELF